jgi:predicted ATPase
VVDDERRATTEALFRNVNERIAESMWRFEDASAEFVCECADPMCTRRIAASLADYERVREDGATFLVAPGHEDPRIERVVEERPGFSVVEKVQSRVRAIVRRLDPRRRPPAPETQV